MVTGHNSNIVSVIIPTYNRSRLLGYTLDSLVHQTVNKSQFEVIVIDDGSSDDTHAVIGKYINLLNIQYFYHENKGRRVSLARNKGICNAKGEICVFIDSGILLGSSCLQEHIASHSNHKKEVAVVGYVYCFDNDNRFGSILETIINYHEPDKSILDFDVNQSFLDIREVIYQKCNSDLSNIPAPWIFFWTCNVSVSTKILLDLDMFDLNYDNSWGMEDVDLGYRLHCNNVKIILNRNANSIHLPHEKEDMKYKRESESKNRAYFQKKFPSPLTDLFMISNHFDFNEKIINRESYKSDDILH